MIVFIENYAAETPNNRTRMKVSSSAFAGKIFTQQAILQTNFDGMKEPGSVLKLWLNY